jgi:acyl-CoA thioesterase
LTAPGVYRPLLTDRSVSWQGVGMDPVARMLDDDAASRALGIEVADASDGNATARMRVRADMVNGHGIAHGAFVFAVADTAFAGA